MRYYHSNVDSDGIMFYVDGDYDARKGSGIGKGSISIHTGGHPHGPQPGAVEASIGAGFFDDAATFPPGLAPLEKAVTDHVARWANPLADAVGPAVLALGDLPEAKRIAAGLNRGGRPVEVSAVVPAGGLQDALDTARGLGPGLRVVSIELKTDPEDQDVWAAQIREAAAVADPRSSWS